MRLKEFQDLLDRYGGDLFEWPPAIRVDALALLKSSVDAQRVLEETRRMESLLVEADMPEPSPEAIDRVMDRIRNQTPQVIGGAVPSGIPTEKSKRSFMREMANELGCLVYRPAILFAAFSLIGVLVGVVDKFSADQSLQQSGFLLFMMNL